MSANEPGVSCGGEVTFVNRFRLRATPESFERVFGETADFLTRQPGFIAYTLLRDVDHGDSYVNVAHWRDRAAFEAAVAHPDFPAHAAALRALSDSEHQLCVLRKTAQAGDDSAG